MANKCPTVTGAANSAYSVDALTKGGCTAAAAMVPLTATWGTTKVLCDQSALAGSSKLLRFADMKANGIACVVFDGTDATVCASTKIYNQANVYYTGSTGSSDCNCTSTSSGGCTLGNGELKLSDKANCGNGQTLTELTKAGTAGCTTIAAAVPSAADAIPAPMCTLASTVTGQFSASGGLTVCCM